MDSEREASLQRIKDSYGAKCRILRDLGDYELLIKVEMPQKVTLNVAVPNSATSITQLDVFLSGDPDLQTKFDTAVRSYLADDTRSIALDDVLRFAENWLNGNLPIAAASSTSAATSSKKSSKARNVLDSTDATAGQCTSTEASSAIPRATTTRPKPNRSPKPTPADPADPSPRQPPMKTAADVIARLRWDSDLNAEHFRVGYVDRFVGIVEKAFGDFNWTDDFVDVDLTTELAVPQHRIQYFKYKEAMVWDKNERFDAVFNSGRVRASLERIMREEDEKSDRKEEEEEEAECGRDY